VREGEGERVWEGEGERVRGGEEEGVGRLEWVRVTRRWRGGVCGNDGGSIGSAGGGEWEGPALASLK
jgi:hypothetical protein